MDLIRTCVDIASNPKHTIWICPLLFLADAALCGLVVWKIPYTEIDWKAYMKQVSQYIAGERDYTKLYGDTGPLVYPAAHVYIYRLLHYVTNEGKDIRTAQYIFVALYLSTLALVMQCYRQAKVPPYVFPLLILSKRLHSIFMLRLFNDGFAVFFLFGLGVKMSLLLALPAVGVVLWQGMGRDRALRQAVVMGQLQVLLGYPFLAANPRSYLSRAFELSRQFLFKWTVNWRFVGEQTFLSRPFSLALLGAHAAVLTAFLATRWLKPTDVSPVRAIQQLINPPVDEKRNKIARKITSDFTLASILASIVIGCLCARSLHYQFYTYIAWSTPFLLWRSGMHPVLMYGIWAAQEWAWNVYPSTNASSGVVVGVLAMTVVASWLGSGPAAERPSADSEHKHEE
ncbi:dolichyl-P-Man:Man(5)GlcNAc(2)-PP-dolichol alpha-1,3-mannosyltransferase [Friedmanniomyces endolithicus]|uniref:Dol-P-Man:Man(5)GlcNAc(2)-PP-Dol alpha-1,3-mannosyltransferase n=1 Tax=Rachicladosporium monterosium TaxID=1507873 RepID=A0ABR0LBV0_9PEZI|nr:dolichyl-P-Man:Man(5)GlcNAc(2)-PP-dolichol alpha-1,3-mannosyltransferase [Friedmanniomyces endolithicus]KAK5145738.1 dolichyl-P-Man:Man(5)GlcNAc(2)-PP-dolichol alpha-1,3-mannosyltransferase [Rachicladosporium monterosium]